MKKIILFLTVFAVAFILFQMRISSPSLNNSIYDSTVPYSFKGKIYIGNENYLDNLTDITDDDVLILDQTFIKNPNFRIYDSYRFSNVEDIDYILNYLLEYEKNNPSKWERSLSSMRNEWIAHNFAYNMNINKARSKDLDLDNEDEERFSVF